VYRGTSPAGESFLAQTGATTGYRDTGLTVGTNYYYTVTALNIAGEGPASNEANATAAAPPTAPRNFTGAPCPQLGKIDLHWQAPASDGGSPVTGYRLYRGATLIATLGATTVGYTDISGGLLVENHYSLTAMNAAGEGPAATACSMASPWPAVAGVPTCVLPKP